MLSKTQEESIVSLCGAKVNVKLAACTLCSFCTKTQPSFVKRRWYSHSCCQWHDEDPSDIWIIDTRWKVMVVLEYWTLRHFKTQTLQLLDQDWWYFLHRTITFCESSLNFGVKIRVEIVASGTFVSLRDCKTVTQNGD